MCIVYILGTGIWQKVLVIQDLAGKVNKCLGLWQLCAHMCTEADGRHRLFIEG